ncbi:hypothetical protein NKH47_21610 [Mesorhizobium sp. M1060]|uniref:hypothetical protein n=1 Tax=Mesorhizobium sp. M1060 TaxID=2957052 RepID=UPI0033373399
MAEHLPNVLVDDMDDAVAISDLADQVMKAADREGISSDEISGEVGIVFEVVLEAMKNRAGGEGG